MLLEGTKNIRSLEDDELRKAIHNITPFTSAPLCSHALNLYIFIHKSASALRVY